MDLVWEKGYFALVHSHPTFYYYTYIFIYKFTLVNTDSCYTLIGVTFLNINTRVKIFRKGMNKTIVEDWRNWKKEKSFEELEKFQLAR